MVVKSNTVTVIEGAHTAAQTVQVTIHVAYGGVAAGGASVTINGSRVVTGSSGNAVFTLDADTSYTASAEYLVQYTRGPPPCYHVYRGSAGFTTGTAPRTVDISLTYAGTLCA